MAIYYKDFNGKVRTVVAGKAPFPVADNLTLGGVKVTGGPGESAPYKVMSEGAVDSKLFDYAKQDHTHLMKDVYKLDEYLDSRAPIEHIHDDRYYTESEVDGIVSQISTRIDEVDDELAGKAPISHTHSDYLTTTQAGEVYQPKSAMALYATKEDLEKMGGAGYIYQLAEFDTTAGAECLQALKSKKSIAEIVLDATAMQAVANSPLAMQAVAESRVAMKAIISAPDAMTAVANSSLAMYAIANNEYAIWSIGKSSSAMNALWNSKNRVKLTVRKGGYGDKVTQGMILLKSDGERYSIAYTKETREKGTATSSVLGQWLTENYTDPFITSLVCTQDYESSTFYVYNTYA